MYDTGIPVVASRNTMRRTLLTLLAAVGAFGIMTASYATADLPEAASIPSSATMR